MSSLYELTGIALQLEELINQMEEAGGDSSSIETLYDAYLKNEDDATAKRERICMMIRTYEASAKAKKEEADRLAASAKVDENNVRRLKDLLKFEMDALGLTKASAGLFQVAVQQNSATPVVYHEKAEDPEFLQALVDQDSPFVEVIYKLNKEAIREALKTGAAEFVASWDTYPDRDMDRPVMAPLASLGERGAHVRIR